MCTITLWDTAKKLVPGPVIETHAGIDIAIVSIGSCEGAVHEAIDVLEGRGVVIDSMRVRAFPFGEEVERFLAAHRIVFVVEQNRDAQLRSLLALETAVEKEKLRSSTAHASRSISCLAVVCYYALLRRAGARSHEW